MSAREVVAQETDYGFQFGAAEVVRLAAFRDGAVCLRIKGAGKKHVDVYVSPRGLALRVLDDNAAGTG
jgi:hypothetical protein